MGSRYCETDRLSQIAWDLFGHVSPGWGRVQAICDFVNRHIGFDYMNARATRTAFEAYQEGIGVCRDYAHLAIAFCRCMNIPARYVNGYLGDIGVPILDPMDFSAWIEVYLGGRWMTFDPRNNMPRIGRIVVARGRDAVDVPLINSFGPHVLKSFRVWAYDVANCPPRSPAADAANAAGTTAGVFGRHDRSWREGELLPCPLLRRCRRMSGPSAGGCWITLLAQFGRAPPCARLPRAGITSPKRG